MGLILSVFDQSYKLGSQYTVGRTLADIMHVFKLVRSVLGVWTGRVLGQEYVCPKGSVVQDRLHVQLANQFHGPRQTAYRWKIDSKLFHPRVLVISKRYILPNELGQCFILIPAKAPFIEDAASREGCEVDIHGQRLSHRPCWRYFRGR
jgi:hypothetical protein